MKEIKIKEEYIKLDSALKLAGLVGTGGQAKMMILDGFAKVNGTVCTQRGKKLYDGDKVLFENFEFVVKSCK